MTELNSFKGESDQQPEDQELAQLRSIVLGKDNQVVKDAMRSDARDLVSEVISEAIVDRQKQDGSLNNVLQPLVEESVQKSVTHHSDKMVSALYPLMGNLVRKYVTSFLGDFLERTNQLIESSLTVKSLKWRFEAKRVGMGYAQYVASQTFVYRVEHVFLIHGETGLLLNSVAHNDDLKSDADIISSMLTAINDFVGDSFLDSGEGEREQLQSVSTDNFNLVIKPGPRAILVAAAIGHPPQHLSDQLQLTLEQVHSLYSDQLTDFDGDNTEFENTEPLLRECLISQQKTEHQTKQKPPWYGILLTVLVLVGFGYLSFLNFTKNQLLEQLQKLNDEPGIVVQKLSVSNTREAYIEVMRDPAAISIEQWLKANKLEFKVVQLNEQHYQSTDTLLKVKKANKVISEYNSSQLLHGRQSVPTPSKIEANWQGDTLFVHGLLSWSQQQELTTQLISVGLQPNSDFIFSGNSIGNANGTATENMSSSEAQSVISKAEYQDLINQISGTQIDFDVNSATINDQSKTKVILLANKIKRLQALSESLNLQFGLIIIGASDGSGNKSNNIRLSKKRADSVAGELVRQGINSANIYTVGLGQLALANIEQRSRTVLFNVISFNP